MNEQYLTILQESLQKKIQILDEIYTKKHVTYNLNIKNMNKETLYINSNNLPGDFLLIHENNSGIQNNSSNLRPRVHC